MKNFSDLTPNEMAQLSASDASTHLSFLSIKLSQASLRLSNTSLKFTQELCDSDDCGLGDFFDFKEKVCDGLFRLASRVNCRLILSQLKDQRDEVVHLFTVCRPIMVRANRLLAAQGIVGVTLKHLRLEELDAAKNIEEEFDAIYNQADHFIDKVREAADHLSDLLDQHQSELKTSSPQAKTEPEASFPAPTSLLA